VIVGIFCAIFGIAFALVAVVQTAYGRNISSGAMRAMGFAGSIISIFATQAQIGRTASENQPEFLLRWYTLLQLFEFNPNAVRPIECMQSTSSTTVLAPVSMSLGLACVVIFMLLAIPVVTRALIRIVEMIVTPILHAAQSCKKKESDGKGKGDAMSQSAVLQTTNPLVRGGPGGGGIEMTDLGTAGTSDDQADVVAAGESDDTAEQGAGADSKATAATGPCACGKKTEKVEKPPMTPRELAAQAVGHLRKGLAGAAVMLHPIVVTYAFRSVHCIIVPGKTVAVLARNPSVPCFEGGQAAIFVLAVATIVIETIFFPLFVTAALGVSVGWFSSCIKAEQTPEPPAAEGDDHGDDGEEDTVKDLRSPGTVHGGLCCRCVCCVECLVRSRSSFEKSHDKATHPARRLAYSSFTFSDYKPEFFFIRILFLLAMTIIAACNTFLDPMTLSSNSGMVISSTMFIAAQSIRFAIIGVTIIAPPVLVLTLLPNKDGARWKMPLRAMAAVVSFGMLGLNAFSWNLDRSDDSDASLVQMNEALSYAVFALSMALLVIMAVSFVIFVVFRGAQIQKKEEEEEEAVAVERESRRRAGRSAALLRREGDVAANAAGAPAQQQLHQPQPAVIMDNGAEQLLPALPAPWTQHETPEGVPYYHNPVTGETIWELPKELPHGWTQHTNPQFNKVYFHHAVTKTSIWHHPTLADETAVEAKMALTAHAQAERDAQAAAAVAAVLAPDEESSESSSSSSSSGSSDSDDDHGGGAVGIAKKKKKKKQKKFVRWVFKKRDDISLSRGLLGGAAPGDLPTYLLDMFDILFKDADSNGDGIISTIELTHVLQRRAKGTMLDGNSLAIFKLKKLLAQQSEHGEIRMKEWHSGLHAAIVGDPNGAITQWILKELQDEAAGWSAHEHEGRPYYSHSRRPQDTSWVRPQVIIEMERCAQLLSAAGEAQPEVHAGGLGLERKEAPGRGGGRRRKNIRAESRC
tara:strand:+ start:1408 stop:4332 length:2925 start_codon:yes stop_codon:yes gene_type:complete